MFSHILIPTDFSPAAWKAVEVGMKLNTSERVEISILHVYPLASGKELTQNNFLPKLDKVKKNMVKLSDNLRSEDSPKISNHVVAGIIEDQLLKFVKDHTFDLVIIGINSNGEDNSLGSHASKLIEESKIPVLVIPNNYMLNEQS